ncbi:MAG: RraA family protein, partial [Burkholderiaceae bacterium]|nr:RraA family protein [Burkholderiaceae bacterium]
MTPLTKSPNMICDFDRLDSVIVNLARRFPASVLADVCGRRGGLHGRIAPLSPSMRLAGTALTVETRPGDNLMIHAALDMAHPGDVPVVDGKGDLGSALMGEIMTRQA